MMILNPKVWIKTTFADKSLAPLRDDVCRLLDHDATVLEVGCGTGDLLIKASSQIKHGHGFDLHSPMIDFAKQQAESKHLSNLTFECKDPTLAAANLNQFDISTSTLCLHTLDFNKGVRLLNTMANQSHKIIIADYTQPKSWLSAIAIECDELLSGHYSRFAQYRKAGYVPAYADACGLNIHHEMSSSIDGITIWILSK